MAAWRWPLVATEIGVMVVLIVRPWLDVLSERRLGVDALAVNPAVLTGLGVLGLAIVLGARRGREGKPLWPDPRVRLAHVWLLGAYLVAVASGVVGYGGTGAVEGARELVRVSSIVAAFLLVCWWVSDQPIGYSRGWGYLLAGATVPIGAAVWQYFTGSGFLLTEGFNRLSGTFSHPNSFGQYLLPFVLVAVSLATVTSGWSRLALALGAGVLSVLIVLTYSRTAELGLLVGLVVIPLLQLRTVRPRIVIQAVVILAATAGLVWLVAGDWVGARFGGLSIDRRTLEAVAATGQSENSFTWRIVNWGILIALGLERPILGHGAGMTTVLNPLVNQENGIPFNAHDDFVRFFFEGGFVGVGLYLMYCVSLILWAIRESRRAQGIQFSAGVGVTASLLSMLILTGGTTELSLHTANLYTLNGFLAVALLRGSGPSARRPEEYTSASGPLSP